MRLFRRTLLCFVVGVTAFGIAGWLFRPKPNWDVECRPANAEVRLLCPERALAPGEPIWIRRTLQTDAEPIETLTVHDARSGAELRRWTLSYNEGRHNQYFGAPGKLIAICSANQTTKFRVFDADTGGVVEHELPANWSPGGANTSAWRFEQRADDDVLHVVDLESGEITSRTLRSPSSRLFGRHPNGDLSPDGRRFAARVIAPGGRPATPALQIWSLDPPPLFQQAKPPLPENTSVGEIGLVRWIDSGRLVEVKISAWNQPDDQPHQHERWHYDPATSQFVKPPADQPLGYPVPGADAEIVKEYQPTAWSVVPTALLERLPEARREMSETRLDWRQRLTNEVRVIGCQNLVDDPQIRADSIITLCETGAEGKRLQSWPLPPRDPRWPSLGVATLGVVATWWVCASRYARRRSVAP